jgi:hypothetical protein
MMSIAGKLVNSKDSFVLGGEWSTNAGIVTESIATRRNFQVNAFPSRIFEHLGMQWSHFILSGRSCEFTP